MKKMVFCFLSLFLALGVANAGTYKLRFQGKIFKGQSVIQLKKEIIQKYGYLSLQQETLRTVVVTAKSALGRGEAYIRVGNYVSRVKQIDGSYGSFNAPGNFSRIRFQIPSAQKGPWQLILRGRIKVRTVDVRTQTGFSGNPNFVTRKCTYLLETVWGKNLSEFTATSSGPIGSGVKNRACRKAIRACRSKAFPLTKCVFVR